MNVQRAFVDGVSPTVTAETVVRKSTDGGFVDTELGDLLDRRGVRRVVVAGVVSEMCVSATAWGAGLSRPGAFMQ